MDRATLLHANRTYRVARRVQSLGNIHQSMTKAHYCTDRDSCRFLARTCTVRLKLYLDDLMSTYAYKFATNSQLIELMELEPRCIAALASSVVGARNGGPPSTTLLISLNGVPRRKFLKCTVVHAKVSHVSPTTPLLRVMINNPFGLFVTLDIVSLCTNLIALASAISEIYMG